MVLPLNAWSPRVRHVCSGNAREQIRLPTCECQAIALRRRSCTHGDRMIRRSNKLLDRLSVGNLHRMNDLSHRLCVAPMMDRCDSLSTSVACNAACANRVHAPAWLYYAGLWSVTSEVAGSRFVSTRTLLIAPAAALDVAAVGPSPVIGHDSPKRTVTICFERLDPQADPDSANRAGGSARTCACAGTGSKSPQSRPPMQGLNNPRKTGVLTKHSCD